MPTRRRGPAFYLAFDQVTLERAHMADKQAAIQVVNFMQKGAGEQIVAGFFEPFPVDILRGRLRCWRAPRSREIRQAQAAFLPLLLAFTADHFRIHQNELGLGVFFERDVMTAMCLQCRSAAPPVQRRGPHTWIQTCHRPAFSALH